MQKVDFFILEGGLDLQTPALQKKPGALLSCINYEAANLGGYERIQGYERFDGQPSPTDATYYIFNFDAGAIEPSVGDSILGGTSAATGKILAVVVNSGTWAGNDAAGYLVVTKVTGTWVDDENIRDSIDSQTHAVANGTPVEKDATTNALHETYLKAAREDYRDDIAAIPGTGDILGVWMFAGDVYAFRNNLSGTQTLMYKSTTSGWAVQDLGETIEFDTGSTDNPAIGETVTGGTSGATGVVTGLSVLSGAWAGNNATGYLSLKTVSGTWTAGETITYAGGSLAETDNYANTLTIDGSYEFITYNFSGQSYSEYMYVCNNVDSAFQWDGSGFAWLKTGATDDTPNHIFAHKRHLFLSVDSSVSHSAIGDPLDWTVLSGAGEIATGDSVTGFSNLPGDTLAILTRNSTYVLYGSSTLDWNLTTFSNETGAIEKTIQSMGSSPKFLDDRGITSMSSTEAYGDFHANTLSELVDPIIRSKKTSVNASVRVREKDQYRLFFNDNTALYMRQMGGKKRHAFTTIELDHEVKCCESCEDTNGTERLFFGSDDGFVYELDKGDSFDGENITCSLKLAFHNIGSPRNKKRFFKVVLDIENTEAPSLSFVPDFSYGDPDVAAAETITDNSLKNAGGDYDAFDNWGSFSWDGVYTGQAEADLDGSGLNMSMLIVGDDNYGAPHRIHGATIHYAVRGLKR